MPSECNATQNEGIHVHVEPTRKFSHKTKWQQESVDVTRRTQRHSQIVCMLKPRDAQSVTSLRLKRELENVRRELRNLKTEQHENKTENAAGKMTTDEEVAHERTGHATYDPEVRNVSRGARSVNKSTKSSCGSCIL